MGIKSSWIRFKGGADYYLSGLFYDFPKPVVTAGILGAVIGSGLAFVSALWSYDQVNSFSDDVDQEMKVSEDGTLFSFPDNCGLDDNHYLVSKKPGGGYEIGRDDHRMSLVLPVEEQQKIVKKASECMDVMRSWALKGNYEFMDDVTFTDNVPYTEAGVITVKDSGNAYLYKDIVLDDGNKPSSLASTAKASDEFVENGDNALLYSNQFSKMSNAWREAVRHIDMDEVYFEGNKIKNIDSYQHYEFDKPDLAMWTNMMAGSAFAIFFAFGTFSDTPRGSNYRRRKDARDEQLAALDALSGRDKPIL